MNLNWADKNLGEGSSSNITHDKKGLNSLIILGAWAI
jgi:hypothetical protein